MILLSFVFIVETMSPSVDLADLSRIPVIAEHFKEHRLEHPEITFLTFLRLHYGTSDHRKHEHRGHHHKLPFSKRLHHHHSALQTVPEGTRVFPIRKSSLVMTITAVIYHDIYGPRVATSVWQPPKI
ncbi:hypothetical protein [Dawidia soli]|uniref:Uncharacterized protein n=1 Tax=Dawidia soli TaxID=2782352 RepID=A0AAP2GCL5_9BACT|nr:hypothetical protein [Dawidia soli]MBT1686449.1 hypothetical protein [Dawidia soli]